MKTSQAEHSQGSLSGEQLDQLARRARETDRRQESERDQWHRREQRRRRLRRRVFIWIIELFVLLAVIEIFILTPRRAEREALRRKTDVEEITPSWRGEKLSPLKDQALSLTALDEATPAYRISLQSLSAGSGEAENRQLSYATENKLPVEVKNSIDMRFRLIPPGSFTMGSPADETGRWDGEKQHQASVPKALYFAVFEVTQEQWQRVMGTSPAYFQGGQRPVESITWEEARRFTRELARKEGLPDGTYRLPSETEWEYACRAGTATAYVFGNAPAELRHFAAYDGNSHGRTHAVGRYHPNAWGLHDMHGNVWEWCRDIFSNYPEVHLPDPTDGKWYNIRGGNWREQVIDCRSATRTRLPPDSQGNILGFRIIRTIPELYSTSDP